MKIHDLELNQSFDSTYELLFAHQLKDAGIGYRTQFSFEGSRYRYDFYLFELKAVVEINGGTWTKGGHSSGTGIIRDYKKLNLASMHRVRSFAFVPAMVEDGSAIETIKLALAWQNKFKDLTK
jgi:hypothetical protein